MLTIQIVCVGKMSQKWFQAGLNEYQKRLGAFDRIIITEIPEHKVTEDSNSQREEAIRKEGEQILKVLSSAPKAKKVALCVEGKEFTSEQFALLVEDAKRETSKLIFVIGGSAGLAEDVKRACEIGLSMSKMTFPHQMARMILMEQLYRAETINSGMKYHK